MKKTRLSEAQIIAILKEGESGIADACIITEKGRDDSAIKNNLKHRRINILVMAAGSFIICCDTKAF